MNMGVSEPNNLSTEIKRTVSLAGELSFVNQFGKIHEALFIAKYFTLSASAIDGNGCIVFNRKREKK
uniref:Uncharacterized protein n=1 Tax=Angiostrongylus cantonensis TaxID=6313 RepID=A0A0K0DCI6_ANGCA